MQTGVIDAVEWVGPLNDRTLELMEVAEYYYYPGCFEPGAMLGYSERGLRSLTPDLQSIVEEAARATNGDMLDEFTARNNQSLTSLIDEHGTKLRPLPDDVDVLYANAVTALDALKRSDPMAAKIGDSYEAFLGSAQLP